MPNVNIRLRTARVSKNGTHPVCLQVTWKDQVRFKTIKGFACKKQSWDFDNHCFLHSERKNELLKEYEKKARRIADYMEEWDYNHFVKQLTRSEKKEQTTQKKLIAYTGELEKYYKNNRQIGYSLNFKALVSFLNKCFTNDLRLQDFGERELNKVLSILDSRNMNGYTTMKILQIVLSSAIQKGFLKADDCPIKTKYSPQGYDINKRKGKQSKHIKKNRIKDLTEQEKEQVVNFYFTQDIPPTQKKHLAFWVLAYKLYGVNFKDIALMKWSDIQNGYWFYSRAKTGVKSATGKPIPKDAMDIMKQYDTGGKYIFDILNGYDDNVETIQKRLHNYKSNVRRSLKQISKRIQFSDERYITWYSTRYTSATLALSKGIDLNTVRTMLDHTNIKSTNKYLGYVRDKEKLHEAMNVL